MSLRSVSEGQASFRWIVWYIFSSWAAGPIDPIQTRRTRPDRDAFEGLICILKLSYRKWKMVFAIWKPWFNKSFALEEWPSGFTYECVTGAERDPCYPPKNNWVPRSFNFSLSKFWVIRSMCPAQQCKLLLSKCNVISCRFKYRRAIVNI